MIPRFIQLLKEDKKVTIQGDGSCVRVFLHSYDTASAFEAILEKGKIGEIYNIGCDENMEYSVLYVANQDSDNVSIFKFENKSLIYDNDIKVDSPNFIIEL